RGPRDVLGGILDIAGFAVHAVLGVNQVLQTIGLFDPLEDTRGAVSDGGAREHSVLDPLLPFFVTNTQMHGLIRRVGGAGIEERAEPIECQVTVRFRVINPSATQSWFEASM